MNRRNCLKLLAAVLPCAFVARMLGEKDLHGTPSPNPYHCAIQTNNLHGADDSVLAKEFEKLNQKIEYLINKAKKRGHEIRDVKFFWRNINTERGPDKFVRVLMRSCDPSYPVYETNIAHRSDWVLPGRLV
jgi:hypothetical protein